MITNIDWNYCNTYPRIYPIATVMGIPKERIDELFNRMKYSLWIREHLDENRIQLHLAMCMKRLNYFNLPFDFESYKKADIDTLTRVFGKRNIRFITELLEVI